MIEAARSLAAMFLADPTPGCSTPEADATVPCQHTQAFLDQANVQLALPAITQPLEQVCALFFAVLEHISQTSNQRIALVVLLAVIRKQSEL